ncbi:MAG: hypothetical protein ACYDAQ_06505, partial [Mycobacteriales bacterium]
MASEIDLVATYRRALLRHPDVSGILGPILAHHEAHLAAVQAAARTAGGAGEPRTPTLPVSQPGAPPATSAAVLTRLARVEGAAAADRRAQCLAAEGSAVALLGSITAAEAVHAALLGYALAALPPSRSFPPPTAPPPAGQLLRPSVDPPASPA